jgi:hypothetical protein
MKPISARGLLPFGIWFVLGCGARSTLDLLEGNGGYYHAGTTGQSSGGAVTGYGGAILGYGGAILGYGGAILGYGGSIAGGNPGSGGGIIGSGGYHMDGGSPGTGGRRLTGGAGGVVFGGAGGRGGQGGYVNGGAGGRGGTTSSGGTAGMGGRGGAGGSGAVGGIVVTGGTLGTGGVRPTGGTLGTGGSTCPPLAANEELIDDLNDGDRFIPPLNGRSGAWFTGHDLSPDAKMYPDPDTTGFVPSATGDACRKYASYVYGTGYVLWGADFWFGLGSPYDASKYTGISFWARVDAGTSTVVRVTFPDKDTLPDGNLCQTGSSAGANQCYDHYGQRITMSTTWTKYYVSFSSLSQDGWGRGGTGFDPGTLYQVLFMIPVGATFGIWVDDVAFTF